jgi:hypothetical protein
VYYHRVTTQLQLINISIKCTLIQALRLCTWHTAHRGSRGIALPFLDHGTTRGWRVSVTPRPLFTPGKDPVPIVQEAGWAPGPVWTVAENLAKSGFDPRTVQPVASRYTNYATQVLRPNLMKAIPPHNFLTTKLIITISADNIPLPWLFRNKSVCEFRLPISVIFISHLIIQTIRLQCDTCL